MRAPGLEYSDILIVTAHTWYMQFSCSFQEKDDQLYFFQSATLSILSGGSLVSWVSLGLHDDTGPLVLMLCTCTAVFCMLSLPLGLIAGDEIKNIQGRRCICLEELLKSNISPPGNCLNQREAQDKENAPDNCDCYCFNCNTRGLQKKLVCNH